MQTLLKPHQVDDRILMGPNDTTRAAIAYARIALDDVDMDIVNIAQQLYSLAESGSVERACAVTTRSKTARQPTLEHGARHMEPHVDDSSQAQSSEGRHIEPHEGEAVETPRVDESVINTDNAVMRAIIDGYPQDPDLQHIIAAKRAGHRRIPWHLINGKGIRVELKDCEIYNDLLYIKNKLYVPNVESVRAKVIEDIHGSLPGGHAGKHGTYHKVHLWYYWPNMSHDVARYVKNCHVCKRSKAFRDGKHGTLHPLHIPERYWSSISVDFITPMPPCLYNGITYSHIMVVVDRKSKMKKFIPLTDMRVETVVQAFIKHVWRSEGYPNEIISDRGSQFVAHFWKRFCNRLGITPKLSTAFHPQTDGQTENANGYLKQYLRAFVNYDQDNWVPLLPFAEFEANSTESSSTKLSPFYATKGYHPKAGYEPPTPVLQELSYPAKQDVKRADAMADRLAKLQRYSHENLVWA